MQSQYPSQTSPNIPSVSQAQYALNNVADVAVARKEELLRYEHVNPTFQSDEKNNSDCPVFEAV